MKRKILLLLVIQTFFSIETIFGQITFQKTFGGTNRDYSYAVQQTTDGGYIISGQTNSYGAGDDDVYLIKTDAMGDTLWTKTFGGTGFDWSNSVQQTTDGGYIIAGWTSSFGAGNADIYLIKTDANGDTLWTKTFGGTTEDDVGNSIQQTTDGGYIIACQTRELGAGNHSDVYFLKTDANGDSLWTRTFGGANDDEAYFVRQTSDGYIITGATYSFGAGHDDVYLIKTDANGNSIWSKTYGGAWDDVGRSVEQTMDGGYIITGYTASFGAGSDDAYLIKTDSSGNSIWTKTFGGAAIERANSVEQTTDGGYIITAPTYSFGAGTVNACLIKTNSIGDTLWTRTFGGTSSDACHFVQQTTDGGYIIVGPSFSFGAGDADIYLIKTDSLGNSGCNEASAATIITTPATQVTSPATIVTSTPTIVTAPATIVGSGGIVTTLCTTTNLTPNPSPKERGVAIAPNPFSNEINIHGTTGELSEITLYDITSGKLLQQTFTNSVSINTSKLSKGIYIYEVLNKHGVVGKGKAVKE